MTLKRDVIQPTIDEYMALLLERDVEFGHCLCGCGGRTTICDQNHLAQKMIRGFPRRFINGHQGTKPRVRLSDGAPFKIDGVYCRLIPLTRGQYAIVDDADYAWLSKFRWFAAWNKNISGFYARRNSPHVEGETQSQIGMHSMICQTDDGRVPDHINRNTLDNRRKNLRPATASGNQVNQGIRKDNKSGFKGVHKHSNASRWVAQIRINGKTVTLGLFASAAEAGAAYEKADREHRNFFSK